MIVVLLCAFCHWSPVVCYGFSEIACGLGKVGLHVRAGLLKEYFPHFVRERLVWELIVFNFYQEGRSLRGYVEQVFRGASFLRYAAN